jgi:hypothetical protein
MRAAAGARVVWLALLPIGVLVFGLAFAALATIAARALATGLDFPTARRLVLAVALAGLLCCFVAYGAGCVVALRTLARLGEVRVRRPAFWVLASTALATALPVFLAVLPPR